MEDIIKQMIMVALHERWDRTVKLRDPWIKLVTLRCYKELAATYGERLR